MRNIIIGLVAIVAFAATGNSAFAYELPASVSTKTSITQGVGEVDFSRPSTLEGTFTVDTTSGEEAWITAGDVANGEEGYGFYINADLLYAVTSTGYITWRMPIAFIRAEHTVTVKSSYTPGDGVRFDTSAKEQYSRGIMQGYLPGFGERLFGALNVRVTPAHPVTVTVGSWKYTE